MSIAFVLTLLCLSLIPTVAYAQQPSENRFGEVCFAIADERNNGPQDPDNPQDTLTMLDLETGATTIKGLTGTNDIEAMSFGPNHQIYAANGRNLGTVNPETGTFTPASRNFGTGGGSEGEIAFLDSDGLAFNLEQNLLFGTNRRFDASAAGSPDLLFAINLANGAHIPEFFGPGLDYVVVTPVLDGAGNVLADLDDMQFNPVTGILYGVMNSSGRDGVLVTIDPATGVSTPIAPLTYADTGEIIDDVEGMSFANDGTLYVSSGDNFTGDLDDLNKLFAIDPATGKGTLVGPFPAGPKDYEAIACLSLEASVVLKKYTNGPGQLPEDADTPTGPLIDVGAQVVWTYTFTNTSVLTLTNLSLLDDQIGIVGPNILGTCLPPGSVLAPGESLTCTATGIAEAGQYSNTGTITADSEPTPLFPSRPVSDTDPSHYFGLTPEAAALGDFVWEDTNSNGVQDSGEPGVPDITVKLLEGDCTTLIRQTTTNVDGIYGFVDLDSGDYCVQFDISSVADLYNFSPKDQGGDDATDSDAAPDGKTVAVTLSAGETNLTLDAGLVIIPPPASLGDFVWVDENSNGVQDSGEPGVPNIPVTLLAGDCVTSLGQTTTTNANGIYGFDDLDPGDYCVQFDISSVADLYNFSPRDAGGDDATDSDAAADGKTVAVTLSAGQANLTLDAGLVVIPPPASLGDFVWVDTNSNGIQDTGEPGVPNIPVKLLEGDCLTLIEQTTTNANGVYGFPDLEPGSYCVQFDISSVADLYNFSPKDQGGDDAKDSDAAADGKTVAVTLSAGQANLTLDAGLVLIPSPASLGDFVWVDTNSNGVQDTGEPGVPNIPVTLLAGDCVTSLGQTTTTNANGIYGFDDLDPGDYCVQFDISSVTEQYNFSPKDQGGDDAKDSDAAPDGKTVAVTLSAGQANLTLDAGLVEKSLTIVAEPACIQDAPYVIYEVTANNFTPGSNPVTIRFLDVDTNAEIVELQNQPLSNSLLWPGAAVDGNGVGIQWPGWIFENGQWVEIPSDLRPEVKVEFSVNPSTVVQLTYPPSSPTCSTAPRASLGDFVWVDTNANGVQDTGEPGVPNIPVTLLAGDCVTPLGETNTNADGIYGFTNLMPGDYCVQFDISSVTEQYNFSPKDQGGDDAKDSDAAPDGKTVAVTLSAGQANLTLDAGLVANPFGSIGDRVWIDDNENGIQDSGEANVQGTKVTLFDGNNQQVGSFATTDANGNYLFTGLAPGNYYVVFDPASLPPTYTFTTPNADESGGDTPTDSDADSTGKTETIALGPGQSYLDLDAGIVAPDQPGLATIGDTVWFDINRNGLQDSGEPGVPNVQVSLFAADTSSGSDAEPIESQVTNSGGKYLFDSLPPGSYYLEFATVEGYTYTRHDVFGLSRDAVDSDPLVPWVDVTIRGSAVEAELGEAYIFTINYTNTEALDVTSVVISKTVPIGTFLEPNVNQDWNCTGTEAGSVCTLDIGPIAANASGSRTFTVRVRDRDIDVPERIALVVSVTNRTLARTANVTVAAGDEDLTIDGGLTVIRTSFTVPTPTEPTDEPPTDQPGIDRIYLPTVEAE